MKFLSKQFNNKKWRKNIDLKKKMFNRNGRKMLCISMESYTQSLILICLTFGILAQAISSTDDNELDHGITENNETHRQGRCKTISFEDIELYHTFN